MVYVKWRNYDDVTAEPVSVIVRDTRSDPDILNQIQEAQRRYRDEHPVRVPGFLPMVATSHLPGRPASGNPRWARPLVIDLLPLGLCLIAVPGRRSFTCST